MTPPVDPRLRRLAIWSAAVAWTERAWGLFAWPLAALGLFALAGATGLTGALPGALRLGLLAAALAALVAALAVAVRRVPWPEPSRALRRLEEASSKPRGSVAVLTDRPVDAASAGSAAWRRARDEGARGLRPALPHLRPRTAAVLATAGLAALAAGIISGPVAERLGEAFSPYAVSLAGAEALVTVAPPAAMNHPAQQLVLRRGETRRIGVPGGARIGVRVRGPAGDWTLRLDGREVGPPDGALRLRLPARGGTALAVHYGTRRLALLKIALMPDAPPRIAWTTPPATGPDGRARLAYHMVEDRGLATLELEVADTLGARRLRLSDAAESGPGELGADLAEAAREVRLTLVARDGAGQEGRSETLPYRPPPRVFRNPAARAVAAARADLIAAPDRRFAIGDRLTGISADPRRLGPNPKTPFAALRAAEYRLRYDFSAGAVATTARLLWDTAVALEEGPAGPAAAALRRALDALERAIASGAQGGGSPQEMQARADAIRQALAELMAALGQQGAEGQPQGGAGGEGGGPSQMVDARYLEGLAEAIAERLAAGDMEGARGLLGELRRLTQNLRPAGAQGQAQSAPAPGLDPLGRGAMGIAGGRLRALDPERARQIEATRRILEQRAADPARPQAERDYYLRLLNRF